MYNDEEILMNLAKKISDAPKSAFSIIGVILHFSNEEYIFLRDWYKKKTGKELDIVIDVLDLREMLRNYLRSKGIEIVEDKVLDVEQYNQPSSVDYMNSWNNDKFSSKGNRR